MTTEVLESSVVDQEVITAYNSSRLRTTRRIAFFESDGETPWREQETSRQAIEGSVTIDGTREERRNITLKALNTEGVLDNKIDGLWYDKIIKAYKGIKYWSNRDSVMKHFEYKVGEFMIDNIKSAINSPIVEITGTDYSKRLQLDQFDQPTTFNEGTTVDELVRAIAINGGIKKFALSSGHINVAAIAAFEAETPRWEAIQKICQPYNVEAFFDNEGRLATRRFKDVSTGTSSDFELNAGGTTDIPKNLVSASKSSSDSQVFNVVRVYATGESGNVTGARFVAVRSNTNLESPTCIQRIGRRPTSYSSDLFTSQEQVDEYADRFLAVSSLEDFSFGFESMMYPWIEANDIIRVYERAGEATGPVRYLLSEFSIPIGLGTMSGTGKRITKVGHVDTI